MRLEGTAARPLVPRLEDDVGFDRGIAARIENLAGDDVDDGTHVNRTPCCSIEIRRASACQLDFGKSRALDGGIERDERLEQRAHAIERPCVGAVRQGLGRVGVRLHEHTGDAGSHCCAREYRNELTLPTTGGPLPAWELHGVGCIEYHRTIGGAHDGERSHVRDQVVVSETKRPARIP